jgi:cell division septation protein DedD
MSNKQVIAIFVIGIALLFAAFWVGLFIVKPDVPASASSTATAAGNQGNGQASRVSANASTSAGTAPGAANALTAGAAAASDDTRYVVLIGTFGTLEQAKQLVAEMRHDYPSTFVKMPTGDDTLYHAAIGPYNKSDAERVAADLSNKRRGVMIKEWTPN